MFGRVDPNYYKKEYRDLEKIVLKRNSHKLRDFILYMAGGATPKTTESEKYYTDKQNGVPFLRVQNLSPEGLQLDDCKYINQETHNGILVRSKVYGENLLIKITGVGRMAISSVAPKSFESNINQHMVVIRTESEKTSKLLAAFLNSDIGEKLASRRSTGGTRPALDYAALRSIPVILDEDIIKIMDAAYEEKRKKEQQAKILRDSINSYLLEELGIVMPKEEENTLENRKFYVNSEKILGGRFDPFFHKKFFIKYNNAIHSGINKVNRLGYFIDYITYGASVDNCYTESGIPLLRIKDLKPNEIDSQDIVYLPIEMEKELRTSRVSTGDILISRSGTIGICSVVDKNHDGYAFGSFMIKFSVFNINSKYISYIINSDIGKKYFERHKIGAIQGNITIPTIKSFPIPTPEFEKQIQIIQNIDSIREQAKCFEQQAKAVVDIAKAKVEKILLEGSL